MVYDSVVPFGFPAICRKKVTAAFDGGRLTSDGGVLLLAQAERRMGIAGHLANCIADPRDQSRVVHGLGDILRARMLAIACGYLRPQRMDQRIFLLVRKLGQVRQRRRLHPQAESILRPLVNQSLGFLPATRQLA